MLSMGRGHKGPSCPQLLVLHHCCCCFSSVVPLVLSNGGQNKKDIINHRTRLKKCMSPSSCSCIKSRLPSFLPSLSLSLSSSAPVNAPPLTSLLKVSVPNSGQQHRSIESRTKKKKKTRTAKTHVATTHPWLPLKQSP